VGPTGARTTPTFTTSRIDKGKKKGSNRKSKICKKGISGEPDKRRGAANVPYLREKKEKKKRRCKRGTGGGKKGKKLERRRGVWGRSHVGHERHKKLEMSEREFKLDQDCEKNKFEKSLRVGGGTNRRPDWKKRLPGPLKEATGGSSQTIQKKTGREKGANPTGVS